MSWLDEVPWNGEGLIAAVAQDATSGRVLTVAWMNRDALMLRSDVVEAIASKKFHVYAVSTVEEGIELLAGIPAGVPDENGHYAEGTVFRAAETRLKRFHPNIERSRLIENGYVAAVSQHSRGDTVDITLVELPARPVAPFSRRALYGACTGPAEARAPDGGVDMGTGYDCFDPLSHTKAAAITPAQRLWRQTLVEAMAREGFRNYAKEWWHFTLARTRSARSYDVRITPRRQP